MNLGRSDIVELLNGRGMPDEELFAAARAARFAHFGENVVVRGVIEVTNLCRVNCTFCPMRRDNTAQNATYLLDDNSLLRTVEQIHETGINVVFLQGGEVPQTTSIVERVAPRILDLYDGAVEILLNLGSKSHSEYLRLKNAGGFSYILKHETANADLYRSLKFESLEDRMDCLRDLLAVGFKVGTGSIIGLPGQTVEDIADDILLAKTSGTHMVSASPFVPAPNTPLVNNPRGSVIFTLRSIAISRLLMPEALIPSVSALEANSPGGQNAGLHAGANVMTVNFTPRQQQGDYLIYGVNRYVVTIRHVQELLKANGLRMGSSHWVPRQPVGMAVRAHPRN